MEKKSSPAMIDAIVAVVTSASAVCSTFGDPFIFTETHVPVASLTGIGLEGSVRCPSVHCAVVARSVAGARP